MTRFYELRMNFSFQSQKFDGQVGVQCGSHVAKSWSVFIEETDKMSKMVKEMADSLATSTLEKLNNLYLEKKTNRKQHQEEYARYGFLQYIPSYKKNYKKKCERNVKEFCVQ